MTMDQPFILCGLGRIGWRVLDHLRAAGLSVVVIDTNCAPDDHRLERVRLVKGDCRRRELLEEAGVARARGVLIMTNDDLVNISTALMVRHLHPNVRIVMRLFNQNLVARLGKAVTNVHAVSTATLTAPLFALTALTGQALGTIHWDEMRHGVRQVAELAVSGGSPLRGQDIATVIGQHEVQVLAHLPEGGKTRFLLDVNREARLIPGDRLIVCGEPQRLAQLLGSSDDVFGKVRWAGWLRRFGRVLWRTLIEVDLAVKICGAVLAAVVVVSTIIFYLAVPKDHGRAAHALFRTISLIATGSDMHVDELPEDWHMVFASSLRIFGALLMAAFTAIVTNYLLRARLSGVLEVRRIPDSGHVVVCGLGNIGFRVVEELVRSDERVVVIEQSRDSRFVTTARRLGVPVLIGDATVAQVLRQAHAAQARAVIAATSDDLINLEVALMVRELNASQRVVLHLSDPTLAQTLREAANVRLALSIPALAAPAFVASLFGDRVQSVFVIDGRLLATVDLLIPPEDPCLAGQAVRAVAIDYSLLPIAVLDPKGKLQPQAMAARLEPGSRLIAVSFLPDLERLLRREPASRTYVVEVSTVPDSVRPWIDSLLKERQGLTASAADGALDKLPACLANNLTRGQAEDLKALLGAQKVDAVVRNLGEQGP
jgi:Trk K+ transport system NAD-binding subunit